MEIGWLKIDSERFNSGTFICKKIRHGMDIIEEDCIEKQSIHEISETHENTDSDDKDIAMMDCEEIKTSTKAREIVSDYGNETKLNEEKEDICEDIREVTAAINGLSERVDQLGTLFDTKIMRISHEEKIVDQMHAELQKYKEDMYAQLVRPVLMDIIEIRDSILRVSKVYETKSEEEQLMPLKTFSGYAYDIQDILEKNNINIYRSKEGEEYIPIRQRVIKKVSTPNEECHGKIAESMSDGYEYMGKTISPEKIAVFVYEATENKEEE